MILIYCDVGVSSQSVTALSDTLKVKHEVMLVTGADLQQQNWMHKTKLLIIPGGRSLPFYEKLGTKGNHNIIEFVKQGGCYLGLCAGAYYACRQTIFARDLPLELILPGELHFFDGAAIGPVFADEDFTYGSEKGARIVDVEWDNTPYPVYFNGGCYFEETDNASVLARYTDNQKPAIIRCQIEKGRAILSGVHPELSYQTIPDDADHHHQLLRKKLTQNDAARQVLFEKLLAQCCS